MDPYEQLKREIEEKKRKRIKQIQFIYGIYYPY